MAFSCVFFVCKDFTDAFLFATIRPKRKALQKKNGDKGISRSAERDKGSAPLTAPPFEKGGRKLFLRALSLVFALLYHLPQCRKRVRQPADGVDYAVAHCFLACKHASDIGRDLVGAHHQLVQLLFVRI